MSYYIYLHVEHVNRYGRLGSESLEWIAGSVGRDQVYEIRVSSFVIERFR